eukprot:TRINITY_DN34926_c0_g1_i1.p1 TRINITY_DN34926_c0_g1~~TRINITY_DN34926_c0_g1_i1.p1  ORF type:complete len:345 (+),score=99.30 TRINITY_DN34926_c0_g1_i1:96-1037(+)
MGAKAKAKAKSKGGENTGPGPWRTREQDLLEQGDVSVVIGVDEAGRGPLAGPVVAAACQLPETLPDDLKADICDSKLIAKEERREEIFSRLQEADGFRWVYAVVSAGHIDGRNILNATLDGMERCCRVFINGAKRVDFKRRCPTPACDSPTDSCHTVPAHTIPKTGTSKVYALVDGNRLPPALPCGAEAIVKGDAIEMCISVASIVAKVTRDRLMHQLCKRFPVYSFSVHKGYPTQKHRDLILQHGVCPDHRRSFAPVKEALKKADDAAKRKSAKAKAKAKSKSSAKPAAKKATPKGARGTGTAAKLARSKKK